MIMGVITTGIISFILIAVNIGFGSTFLKTWSRSWVIAYFVAIPAILVIGPQIQKFVDKLFKEKIHEPE